MSKYVFYYVLGLITRRSQVQILPPPPYFSSVKSVFNLAYYFSGSHLDFDLPNHIPNQLAGFSVPISPRFKLRIDNLFLNLSSNL